MSIHIYNSLSKTKEPFEPQPGRKVRMYSCGVTVYDKCHIGHARSLYVVEVIRCYLQYRGFDVRFVRNITDVDDKIINKANETGRDWKEIVSQNISWYQHDLQALGIPEADVEPCATANIDIMIAHIQGLMDKGFAYAVDGDVYFRVRKFKDYGKLSGQSIEKMLEGVRISKDDKKEDPLDFALWKRSREGEPSWPSPWGPGRPGWHIECSCMSMKYLKTETLDIHAGGRDLIFPHHENEIAQSEALTGKPFARYWVHNGLLTINGQKMAKSLGNFITVEDMIKKYSVADIKMFFLMAHYASAIDFSDEKMFEAHKAMNKIRRIINEAMSQGEDRPEPGRWLGDFRSRFEEAMDDDFNTPRALGVIFELISEIHKCPAGQERANRLKSGAAFIRGIFEDVYGIHDFYDVDTELKERGLKQEVEGLLQERQEARQRKDYKRSDEIRDRLRQKGVVIEDTKDGQKWRLA